ncbi:MAG: bifunctional glutamate N-acetyltransferase/amino-acid acetyltransferase ArgJ [Dehalococcoidia bacterium]|nr:bifunctional glutamate N-acetyltransferase/amino-acid acetyltransferase ArgJ [Dehalococcoidia bacterium]
MNILADGGVTTPKGFLAGTAYADIKGNNAGKADVALLYSERPCTAAGVFTQNKFSAAPVHWSREIIADAQARAIVVNSGNANAGTGDQGYSDAAQMAALAAEHLGLDRREVLVASTGVIGVPLPMDRMWRGISASKPTAAGSHDFAVAIMTTDTVPKLGAVSVQLPDGTVGHIGGTCKGVGMIHPDMATMLGFLTTDFAVERQFLQQALKAAADRSFNMVTVDGDTSTNDTLLILANGACGNPPISEESDAATTFQNALDELCVYLCKKIARDGEGATKLIEVEVRGAATLQDARLAARTIASSPLVKTAVYGNDPNWGRLLAAAGRSGADLDPNKVDAFIGDICLMRAGQPQAYDHALAVATMKQELVQLKLHLHLGEAFAIGWGCDLTEEYVHINADYTT